jgi:energy-coupling factor transport system permease protein
MYHTLTWLLWLAMALLPAMLTRNPLYLCILLAAVAVAYASMGRQSAMASSWGVFLKAGLILASFSVLFNLLTVHYGDTVIVTLPHLTLHVGPAPLLDLGGKTTLESALYGLTSGLSLVAILLIFATFNVLVDHHRLLRFVPSFLYQTGMIASIAIAFVPQMVASLRDIREAQAIRGHRFRGVRDLLPLFVPLLTTGLERAVQLAESMEARGFGSDQRNHSRVKRSVWRILIAAGLFGLLCAAFWRGYRSQSLWVSVVLALGSTALLVGTIAAMGRGTRRSRYRRELWRRRDTLVSMVALASILIICAFWLLDADTLFFYPYPRVSSPGFNPLVGLALLAIVAPVLTAPQMRESAHD